MRCRYPLPLKVVRFVDDFFSFNQLNISCADVPCILGNSIGGAALSTQPVTLYISVKIMTPNLYKSLPSIPTEDVNIPAEETTIPGRIQTPTSDHLSPPSHLQPIETGNTIPQSLEKILPTNTENPHLALHRADEAIMRIVPVDGSNTWEKVIGRIKWVMDTLGPIAEVRAIPFCIIC